MSHHLNAGAENGQRALDIPTAALLALVTLTALIAMPLFGYVHGYTRLDWAVGGILYPHQRTGHHRGVPPDDFPSQLPVSRLGQSALLVAGGWALENSALKWGANHARHHARVDQKEDPYNATRGFWYSHCGWFLTKSPHRTERYALWLREDRVVMWQHRWYVSLVLSGLALPFLVGYAYDAWIGGVGCFLLAGVGRVFLVLNSTFCINSICHLWGSQPYSQSNSSRDSWWVSLITLGDGYHSYHHTFPRDYRNGPLWYNVDPSKWLIYGLSRFGLAEGLVRFDQGDRASSRS